MNYFPRKPDRLRRTQVRDEEQRANLLGFTDPPAAKMPHLAETIELIEGLFREKTDLGGRPYAEHCKRVAAALPIFVPNDERHAALLQDVIEDTDLIAAGVRELGYSKRTVELVEALTRRDGETYADYIDRIAQSGDAGLIRIKLADVEDNLDPARPLPPLNESLRERYLKARAVLRAALDDTPA